MRPEPTELAELAARIAHEVGRDVLALRRAGPLEVGTKSTPTDMVTHLDREAERRIVRALADVRPGDGVVGEEGTDTAGSTGVSWIVDPIDGTTNFLYDLPGWAVSIAAQVDGQVVAGAVAVPAVGDLFSAALGHGARNHGAALRCSTATELATALVGTGFGYHPERRARQAAVAAHLLPRVRDIRRFGAASVDLCHVAAGRLDAYYEEGLAPWDLAAGELVAREAGAITSDLSAGPARAEAVVAAAPGIHAGLLALLREAGAPVVRP